MSSQALAGNDTNGTIILADGAGKQRIFVHNNGNTGIGLGNNVIPANKYTAIVHTSINSLFLHDS